MINILIDIIIYRKLKKEIFNLEEKNKKLQKELKEQKKKTIKYINIKKGELYVVNVCALYFVSQNQIVLTSNKYNLLNKTKGEKYRPIVITSIKPPEIKFIALSTFYINKDNEATIKVDFEIKNCEFFTKDCFLPSIEDNSYIFGKILKRKIKGQKTTQIKGIEYSIPILLLKELEHIESSTKKKAIIEKCEVVKNSQSNVNLMTENYKLIKKCATCDKDYINKILKELEG